MAVSRIKAVIPGDIHQVWDVVLSVEKYTWRTDLSKTERIHEKAFIEYTKVGFPTTLTTTLLEPYRRWEFTVENANMKGHWTGVFTSRGKETEICFTEEVTAKKFFFRPFVKWYLKKQQARFVSDLKRAVIQANSGENLP